MDIHFHYYAVKTIALLAGFNREEAQIMASYSQYVDDYRPADSYQLDMTELGPMNPDLMKYAFECGRRCMQGNLFYPIQTGFTLRGDSTDLLNHEFQKKTVVPFHFIPQRDQITDSNYQVVKAHWNDQSLAAVILKTAADEYKSSTCREQRDAALIHTGIALHVFADTYAHEKFSGFSSTINEVEVIDAVSNGIKDNPFAIYGNISYVKLPAGHAAAGTAPDDTTVCFKIRQMNRVWERVNSTAFIECAGEILNCFIEMLGQDNHSKQNMEKVLLQGFHEKEPDRYPATWSGILREITSAYFTETDFMYSLELMNKMNMPFAAYIGSQKVNRANPCFYYFNSFAKRIRDKVTKNMY